MLKYIYTILIVILISSCSSSNFEFDPGACPRAAFMSGSETNMFNGMSLFDEDIRKLNVQSTADITGMIDGTVAKTNIPAELVLSNLYWTNDKADLQTAMQLYDSEEGNTTTRTFESI